MRALTLSLTLHREQSKTHLRALPRRGPRVQIPFPAPVRLALRSASHSEFRPTAESSKSPSSVLTNGYWGSAGTKESSLIIGRPIQRVKGTTDHVTIEPKPLSRSENPPKEVDIFGRLGELLRSERMPAESCTAIQIYETRHRRSCGCTPLVNLLHKLSWGGGSGPGDSLSLCKSYQLDVQSDNRSVTRHIAVVSGCSPI